MQIDELRALYDDDQRFSVRYPDTRREASPQVVRHVSTGPVKRGWVIWSKLDATGVEAAIDEQIAYFSALGCEFEWKVYSYDTPPDLIERLMARGFEVREPADTIMVLDLEQSTGVLSRPVPAGVQAAIRRIDTPQGVEEVMALLGEVWGEDFSDLGQTLTDQLINQPQTLSMFAAYDGGRAISAAWVQYTEDSQFAGLWGGSTLAGYRRQGFYHGLLAVRAAEARARGRRFLTVDASPMSRPILEKLGFVCIATATECFWKPGGSA